MALSDFIKRALPSTDTVARLNADLAQAQARADAAHEAWAQATAQEQEAGGIDTSRSDQLDEELSRALREVNKLTKSLAAVQARQEDAAATAARADLEDRWNRAEVLASERAEAAARLQHSMREFASCHEDFLKSGADLAVVANEVVQPSDRGLTA